MLARSRSCALVKNNSCPPNRGTVFIIWSYRLVMYECTLGDTPQTWQGGMVRDKVLGSCVTKSGFGPKAKKSDRKERKTKKESKEMKHKTARKSRPFLCDFEVLAHACVLDMHMCVHVQYRTKSPYIHKRASHIRKGPLTPQKSPTYPQKSYTYPWQIHTCP